MSLDVFFIAVIILLICALMDLVVGVSNDAANFLNSAFGSRVASRRVIMIIAGLGIIAGVMFSSGMMEIARKGIFHPQYFTMPQLITIFLAVMLTDILLLDIFNTYGLPTSTTVSLVFELIGASVAGSLIMIMQKGEALTELGQYINTGKAMFIILGILMSVVIAFFFGSVVQFFTRLLFTFDYQKNVKSFGALWGGAAMAAIVFFILVKGAKGASFITPEALLWINTHTWTILAIIFAGSAVIFQLLILFFNLNIFKPVILIGTFALAMAFAANDLVNFIGVPLAGLQAYKTAMSSGDPLNIYMEALREKVHSETHFLLVAGIIMVLTLWISKKARTVSQTELSLGKQEEGIERFESFFLSRIIVRMVSSFYDTIKSVIPANIQKMVGQRINPEKQKVHKDNKASFDLVRAAVNLMVASAVISYATSMKLPLSTTYVTFMVSMGSSFSDKAWGSESAVYRVTGVLTVIIGWFLTAFIAFTVSFLFAWVIHYFKSVGVIGLILFLIFVINKTHYEHQNRVKQSEQTNIFNLEEVEDAPKAISTTFSHMGLLLKEVQRSLNITFDALFSRNLSDLGAERKKVRLIQNWINIIIANIFRTLRLLQKQEITISFRYAQAIRRLQKLSDGYRDIVARSYVHISNNHMGFSDRQVEELKQVKNLISEILEDMGKVFDQHETVNHDRISEKDNQLNELVRMLDQTQIDRIRRQTTKTRLNILYYAIIGDCKVISRQNIKLLNIFKESFSITQESGVSDTKA